MRKVFPLVFIAVLTAANAIGQSGRRIANPPPIPRPPEPVAEALSSRPEPAPAGPLRSVPETIMNRELQSLEKASFRLADFSGKVIVVNLWASWCGPCRREVPDYEKVRKEYTDRGVEFIGLTTEDPVTDRNRVQKFARDLNFGFRLGWADRETAQTLMNGRNVIPQTLVIAGDGRIVSHWRGYADGHSGDQLRQAIESALAETPASAQEFPRNWLWSAALKFRDSGANSEKFGGLCL